MSDRAKARARAADGRRLATVEISVLERGLTPCIPTRARIPAQAKPRPATRESPTASIAKLSRPRSYR